MAEINTLKQDYFLAVSLDIDISDKDLLDSFIGMCLDLYKCSLQIDERLPVGERHTGDDAAILAAMGCIHAFRNGENRALLRCVTVLEILLSHSKHNYDALVMIVRVYIYLGAAKKAMEHYAKLDIKNMQISPLSWIFFTRISTIHPHASKKTEHEIGKNRDTISSPFLLLENAITMAQRNTQNGWSGVAKYLDHESFPNLLDHLDLMKQLEDPLAGYSLICEYLRVCRFGHGRYNDQIRVELNLLDPESILDLRDCSPFPNYEASGQRRCDEYIQPGPKPSVRELYDTQCNDEHLMSNILTEKLAALADPFPCDQKRHARRFLPHGHARLFGRTQRSFSKKSQGRNDARRTKSHDNAWKSPPHHRKYDD